MPRCPDAQLDTGHRTTDTRQRTPGRLDAPPDTGHRSRGHRTRGHWTLTPDTGRRMLLRTGPEASRHGGPGAVGHQLQQPAALQVDQTGDPSGRRRRVARRTLVSSKPRAAITSRRAASSTSGVPWSATARMTVAQPTPRSRATAATAWASLPTRRQASARARWVSTALGRIGAARSVQVCTPQAGSRQRQIRLRQASTTGRPPTEQVAHPDRTAAVGLGPRPSALHPTAVAVVWTASRHSPPATTGGEDLEAVQASSLVADALRW